MWGWGPIPNVQHSFLVRHALRLFPFLITDSIHCMNMNTERCSYNCSRLDQTVSQPDITGIGVSSLLYSIFMLPREKAARLMEGQDYNCIHHNFRSNCFDRGHVLYLCV